MSNLIRVHVKNEDTAATTTVEVALLVGCPIADQAAIRAALDKKVGANAWEWWDARSESGDWITSSEI